MRRGYRFDESSQNIQSERHATRHRFFGWWPKQCLVIDSKKNQYSVQDNGGASKPKCLNRPLCSPARPPTLLQAVLLNLYRWFLASLILGAAL